MFLNAIMLAGIGGAVLPLVLHLMNRARYRTVEWGAMMFLRGDGARQQQARRQTHCGNQRNQYQFPGATKGIHHFISSPSNS